MNRFLRSSLGMSVSFSHGGAGPNQRVQSGQRLFSGFRRQMFEHGLNPLDAELFADSHHLRAPLGQLQAADAAIVSFGDAFDQPGPLQAVGNLGHGAQRDAQLTADGRHGARPATKHAADAQLPKRQLRRHVVARKQLAHQRGQQRRNRLRLFSNDGLFHGAHQVGGWRPGRGAAQLLNCPIWLMYINYLDRSTARHGIGERRHGDRIDKPGDRGMRGEPVASWL
jgi:hypothetical protein